MSHTLTGNYPHLGTVRVVGWPALADVVRPRSYAPTGGGSRGRVVGFSRGARYRMLRMVAESWATPEIFATFTYGAEHPDCDGAREDWRVVGQRLIRAATRARSSVCMIWRLEMQARKAPHFHVLLYQSLTRPLPVCEHVGGDIGATVAEWARGMARKGGRDGRIRPGSRLDWLAVLQGVWTERIEGVMPWSGASNDNSVDVRAVVGRRACAHYVAKYAAKVGGIDPQTGRADDGGTTGRVWGCRGDREVLARGSIASLFLADSDPVRAALVDAWATMGNPGAVAKEESTPRRYSVFVPDTDRGRWLGSVASCAKSNGAPTRLRLSD